MGRQKSFLALAFILFLSLALRLWGCSWGVPNRDRFTTLYVDEYTVFWVLSHMNPAQHDFNPRYGDNPTLSYYQAGAVVLLAGKLGLAEVGKSKEYYLAHPESYGRLYVIGRLLYVAYGVAMTALLFLLGRAVTTEWLGGILAALWYATIPITVVQCHVMDMSVPTSFWIGVSALCLTTSYRQQSLRWLLSAALAAGISFSHKYTAAPLLPVVFYAAWSLRRDWRHVLGAAGLFLMAYLAGSPYILLDARHMLYGLWDMSRSSVGANLTPSWRSFVYPFYHYPTVVGLPLSLLAVTGIVMAIKRGERTGIFAALFLVPFLALLCKSSLHVVRYLNETMPFFLPFAALPILGLWNSQRKSGRLVAIVLALLSLSRVPYTLAIDRSLANETDPRDQASQWIVAHVPEGQAVGIESEATFMTPAHLYMQYWKGQRYPENAVHGPAYQVPFWDHQHARWTGCEKACMNGKPSWCIAGNFAYNAVIKNDQVRAFYLQTRTKMLEGYRPIVSFARNVQWGPFRYSLPTMAGNDWRIYFPELTIYERVNAG